MKHYLIKPEFIDQYGAEANAYTVLTEDDVDNLSADSGIPADKYYEQLIEYNPSSGRNVLCRFSERFDDWQKLNLFMLWETGCAEPYCRSDEEFKKNIADGWITYDGYYTTVWVEN